MTDLAQDYLASFPDVAGRRNGSEPEWLTDLRRRASARFSALGVPGPRDEEFKYTPVARLFRDRPVLHSERGEGPVPELPAPLDPDAVTVLVRDGRFLGRIDGGPLPDGLRVEALRRALRRTVDGVPEWLGRCADFEGRGIVALSTAFLGDGALVTAEPGALLDRPVHLVHLATSASADRVVPIRNLVVAGAGSRLELVEHHLGESGEATNLAVTEIAVTEGARVDHVKLQEEDPATDHLSTVEAVVGRGGTFRSRLLAAGGAIGRTELRVRLAGEGADCDLGGVALARGDEVRDVLTRVEHASPHATSRQVFRTIVDERGRGVFNGLVVVPEGAQGTSADQSSRSLLLAKTAEAHARPQLDIRADDVRCTHGATVGALDPEALFYLRSRGVGVEDARRLLVLAFARDVLDGSEEGPVRERAERILTEWLSR